MVDTRHGVLEFMKIVDFHKLSKEKSKALEFNLASQYSRRFLHLAKCREIQKNIPITYIVLVVRENLDCEIEYFFLAITNLMLFIQFI